jgi:GNAT superfamily N-acetyltransferase
METTATPSTPPTGALRWVKDPDPHWDADRRRVFAAVPDAVFPGLARREGEPLASDWWQVVDGDRVVGYGWLDDVWGDAEILMAVDRDARGTGAGAFALARLEEEAAARGLNYVLNVVRDTHPEKDTVLDWLHGHGFAQAEDGRLRKRVGDRERDIGQHQDGRPGTGTAERPDEGRAARYAAERDRAAASPRTDDGPSGGSDLGPGAEESGGYVDVSAHRF